MKPSGIAKTVDMVVVVTSALFVSFKESHKWNPIYGGREIWNSVLLDICGQCCDSKCAN